MVRKTLALLACALAVVAVSACSSRQATTVGSGSSAATSTKEVTPAPAPAAQEETITPISLDHFGSVKDHWHDALVSVTVRGSDLVIRVARELSREDADGIERTAKAVQAKQHLAVTQFLIIYDENGYLLRYGPLRAQ